MAREELFWEASRRRSPHARKCSVGGARTIMSNPALSLKQLSIRARLVDGFKVRRALPSRQTAHGWVHSSSWTRWAGVVTREGRDSTLRRIRTSDSRPSPISLPANYCTATASAVFNQFVQARLNWMTAGRGIAHSERTRRDATVGSDLFGIQSWVALPLHEEMEPTFAHHGANELPIIEDMASACASLRIALWRARPCAYCQTCFMRSDTRRSKRFRFKDYEDVRLRGRRLDWTCAGRRDISRGTANRLR